MTAAPLPSEGTPRDWKCTRIRSHYADEWMCGTLNDADDETCGACGADRPASLPPVPQRGAPIEHEHEGRTEKSALLAPNQPQEPTLKGEGTMPDDTTLLNWLEASAGPHILFTAHRRRACIAFDARLGLRDAIQRAMYDEAAHEAQRRGWEYEPDDGTWRKDGYLQCVEEALVATIAGGAA